MYLLIVHHYDVNCDTGTYASVVAIDRVGSAAAMSVGAGRVDAGTGVINN